MRLRAVLVVTTLVGCGLDVVGGDAPISGETTRDGGSPSLPQTSNETNDGGGGDAEATLTPDGGDAGATQDPLCPASPDLLGCFAWEATTADDSPRKLTVEAADNLTFAAGREGMAAHFTLTPKSNVRLPFAGFNTPQLTIEAWIRADSLPVGGSRTLLVDMDGRLGLRIFSDGTFSCTDVAATTKVTAGTWVHVACVYDGTTLTAFVNGVAEKNGALLLAPTSVWVGIGQNSPTADDAFDGLIDNLRIWGTARTAPELAAAAAR